MHCPNTPFKHNTAPRTLSSTGHGSSKSCRKHLQHEGSNFKRLDHTTRAQPRRRDSNVLVQPSNCAPLPHSRTFFKLSRAAFLYAAPHRTARVSVKCQPSAATCRSE